MIQPPERLKDPFARNAWYRLQAQSIGKGLFDPQYCLGLEIAANALARYVKTCMACKITTSPELVEERQAIHSLCRQLLVDWEVIKPERQKLVALNDEGIDVDIVKLIAPR